MRAFRTILKIELKLSIRGMDMFIFAICMPVVITIILGIIYGNKLAFAGAKYTFFEQSFGAITTIAICAGSVMGLPLVVSDYRHKKILKRFKVTPVSPAMILAAQVVIYTFYSVSSLILVYGTSKIFFGFRFSGSYIQFLGAYFLVMVCMFSIGIMVGGIAPDLKTAGIIASVLYFPMLIFSGATLPYEIMPTTLQKFANILPLTQGIKLLKTVSLGLSTDGVIIPVIVMIVLGVICTGIALRFFKWE
ncbi:ABC transporter permease [Clostridium oryzae]|nr:ABC transporter permease [Clostridium oryzae]